MGARDEEAIAEFHYSMNIEIDRSALFARFSDDTEAVSEMFAILPFGRTFIRVFLFESAKLLTTLLFVSCPVSLCFLPSAVLRLSYCQAAVVFQCHQPPDMYASGQWTLLAGIGIASFFARSG